MTCRLKVYEFVMHDSLGHTHVNFINSLYKIEGIISQHQSFFAVLLITGTGE